MNNIPQITQNENDFIKSIISFVTDLSLIIFIYNVVCYQNLRDIK